MRTAMGQGPGMPPRIHVDRATRDRIVRWIRFKMRELNLDQRGLAKMIDINEGTVSRALNGGSVGLDLVIALHRKAGISANALLDGTPDEGL